MKFPKPRILLKNEYPDLSVNQPELYRKMIKEIVYPELGSIKDRYLDETIAILKKRAKQKVKAAKLNEIFINQELYFIPLLIKNALNNNKPEPIQSLIDTGAANSLIQYDVAKALGLKFEPIKLTLKTATGEDSDTVQGIVHQKVFVKTTKGKIIGTCVNLIVTKKLNNLDLILGADFLFMNDKIKSISKNDITWKVEGESHKIKIEDEESYHKASAKILSNKEYEFRLENCPDCTEKKAKLSNVSRLANTKWESTINSMKTAQYISKINEKRIIINSDKESTVGHTQGHIKIFNSELDDPETLPNSESAFDDQLELDFKILDKKLSLADADYSECPPPILRKTKRNIRRI